MHFLSSLDTILNRLYNNSLNIIICGDFNINYLENSNNKLQLDSILASYNLPTVVDFPTRITTSSCTAIDNIFINEGINIDFFYPVLPHWTIRSWCPNPYINRYKNTEALYPSPHKKNNKWHYYIRIPTKFKLSPGTMCLMVMI